MEERVRSLLLKFPGTNCDSETDRALRTAGFDNDIIPINLLNRDMIFEYSMVVIPGGFSYGDYIRAGRLAQLELGLKIGDALFEFKEKGGLILGICNGFQILLQLALLPQASLTTNISGRFICKWVKLKIINRKTPFLYLLPWKFELPVAHIEGRFVTSENKANEYVDSGLASLVYEENINGSECGIAGLNDETGRVFGLMPHPERFLFYDDYYNIDKSSNERYGSGYIFFRSVYEYLKVGGKM
ncbi:MAG: phosphoribosylformylglycinamidine synthase I [Candidatus Hydrogenedentota bacterium]